MTEQLHFLSFFLSFWEMVKDREAWSAAAYGNSCVTEQQQHIKCWSNWSFHILLAEMKNSTTTMKSSLSFCKAKHTLTTQPSTMYFSSIQFLGRV